MVGGWEGGGGGGLVVVVGGRRSRHRWSEDKRHEQRITMATAYLIPAVLEADFEMLNDTVGEGPGLKVRPALLGEEGAPAACKNNRKQ